MHKNTERILELLRDQIEQGKYPLNSFLPPERKLCEELAIGRGALQAIFRVLATEGYIANESNKGARVVFVQERRLQRILLIEQANPEVRFSAEQIQLLKAVITAADTVGISTSLCFADDSTNTDDLLKRYSAGEYQGVIVVESLEHIHVEKFIRAGIPLVIANNECLTDIPCAQVDFREVGRIAGREFIRAGLQHIGVISGPENRYIFKEMIAGLKGALAEENCWINPCDILYRNEDVEAFHAQLRQWFSSSDRPQGCFIARDWRAASVYEVCAELGLRIPDDISLISYDDLSWMESVRYGLTTIKEPTEALGSAAVTLLCHWVNHNQIQKKMMVCGELVSRRSVRNMQGT